MIETSRPNEENGGTWLTRHLANFYRGASILCIVAIIARRIVLSSAWSFQGTSSGFLTTLLVATEMLVEMTGLMFLPIEVFVWIRLAKSGYLKGPKLYDYVLLVVLYTLGIGYLPPPGAKGAFHFGR